MPVKVTIESPKGSPYDGVGVIPEGNIGYWVDEFAGRIILAKCMNYKGVDVYIGDGYCEDKVMTESRAYSLIGAADYHTRIMPWMNRDFAYRLPDGQQGLLNLLAQPKVVLIRNPLFFPVPETD